MKFNTLMHVSVLCVCVWISQSNQPVYNFTKNLAWLSCIHITTQHPKNARWRIQSSAQPYFLAHFVEDQRTHLRIVAAQNELADAGLSCFLHTFPQPQPHRLHMAVRMLGMTSCTQHSTSLNLGDCDFNVEVWLKKMIYATGRDLEMR